MRRLILALLLAMTIAFAAGGPALAQPEPAFQLGFEALADQIPGVVGEPVETQRSVANGDAVQQTTTGLMVWRKADNWTAFTDGFESWVNGPFGVQERLNSERFQWELSALGLTNPSRKENLQTAYLAAVKDAETAEPGEISRDLIAITEGNDLNWKGEPDKRKVLVVTWTSWPGYNEQVGKATTAGVETWVTVAPGVQHFCKRERPAEPVLRLEQLLGLPPDNGKKWFVELWVDPADLFRPSADPEITDHEAETDLRDSRWLSASEEHVKWFNELKGKSYGPNGYPWTRLGYSYDWGNPGDEVGLSEFVIRKGAPVEVNSVAQTLEYCQ